MHTLRSLSTAFKALLWPNVCLACGLKTPDPILCEACCALSKHAPAEPPVEQPVRAAIAVWKFDRDEPIRFVLHRLKYGNCPWIGLHLGARVAAFAPPCPIGNWDFVIPVPLHRKRLLERGYNQSEWIARGLGKALGLRVERNALARTRNTSSQTNFSREDRPSNVSGAFAVVQGGYLRESNILLVDDTLTTGATLAEAARTLIESGVSTVQPLTVAVATLRMDEEQRDAGSVIPSRHQSSFHESALVGNHL